MTSLQDILSQHRELTLKKDLVASIVGLLNNSMDSSFKLGHFPEHVRQAVAKQIEDILLGSLDSEIKNIEKMEVHSESEGKKSSDKAEPKSPRRVSLGRPRVRAEGR